MRKQWKCVFVYVGRAGPCPVAIRADREGTYVASERRKIRAGSAIC